MKPIHQTRFGLEKGNCFQAAVASLLELDLEEVPDFMNIIYEEKEVMGGEEISHKKFREWLNLRGLTTIAFKLGNSFLNLASECFKDCYLLVTINYYRADIPMHHCVIYRNGNIIHDPALVKSKEKHSFYSVNIIFPLNPVKVIGSLA